MAMNKWDKAVQDGNGEQETVLYGLGDSLRHPLPDERESDDD